MFPTISKAQVPLLAFLLAGCSTGYDVNIAFDDPATKAQAAHVEVAIVEICSVQSLGAAPASPVRQVTFSLDEASPSLGDFDAGNYGLYARASDADCNVIAAGCTPVVLGARGAGALRVVLSDVVNTSLCRAGAQCVSGRCVDPGDDGGVLDAPASDAGVEDARVVGGDGGLEDAPANDAGAEDTGPTRTYCEQLSSDWGYRYCRDFDMPAEPFPFGWDRRAMDPGGSQQADSNAYSAPNAFLATVSDPGGGACVNAYSEADVSGRASGTGLRFQLRMGSMDGTEPFVGGYMRLRFMDEGGAEQCSLVLYSNGESGGGVVEHVAGEPTVDHPFTIRFPQHYEWTWMTLNVDSEAQTFDVTMNRDTVFSATQNLSPSCMPIGEVIVSIGAQCGEWIPVGSGEVRLDDVNM